MSWFQAFRNDYGFAAYKDNRTPVTVDVPIVIVVYLCVVLGAATLISTLGIRGRERWATTLRASYGVGIFSIILVCLVGHNWLEGDTEVMTHYLYRSDNYFRGRVGLRISLDGCNVTLSGYYEGPQARGHVDYVETLAWKDYGREQENLNGPLARGLPHPVLAVMDFLSVDSGDMRWGRNLHSAGYFAMALLWTALVFWIISQVLLVSVVSYGSFMMIMTGTSMILASVVYHVSQPPLELRIHFGEAVLTVAYGWCFWLNLAAGIVTKVLGCMLFFMDHVFHEKVSEFFNLDKLDDDDGLPDCKVYVLPRSIVSEKQPSPAHGNGSVSLASLPTDRRASVQIVSPGRRNSIFLEPQRRPSDLMSMRPGKNLAFTSFTSAGSGLVPASGHSGGGILNKGFEQELQRTKNNPLFSGYSSEDIPEVPEDTASEARIDMPGDDDEVFKGSDSTGRKHSDKGETTLSSPNRKPSLATMREHRENHMNERHQQRQTSTAPSPLPALACLGRADDDDGSSGRPTTVGGRHSSPGKSRLPHGSSRAQGECTTILIHNAGREEEGNGGAEGTPSPGREPPGQVKGNIIVTTTLAGEVSHPVSPAVAPDSDDSAFGSVNSANNDVDN